MKNPYNYLQPLAIALITLIPGFIAHSDGATRREFISLEIALVIPLIILIIGQKLGIWGFINENILSGLIYWR